MVGAILNSLALLPALLLLLFLNHDYHLSSKEGVFALFGTAGALLFVSGMFSGWVAVGQIRRSAGRLYGLRLAVFDGLLFPLMVLDIAILTVGANFVPVVNRAPGTALK